MVKDKKEPSDEEKTFYIIHYCWLSYMGRLICEDGVFPFKEHVVKYLDWLKQNKGYSSSTTKSKYSQLRTMMLNLKVDGLKDITPSVLDGYIRL